MLFLHSNGVGTSRAVRIYKTYGADAVRLISENPYRLARDIRGIGFRTADQIAAKLGIEKTALIRVRARISYALAEAMDEAHCGLPVEELVPLTEKLLEVPAGLVETALRLELDDGAVVADDLEGRRCVFLAALYRAEHDIAEKLRTLAFGKPPWSSIDVDKAIPWVEQRAKLALADSANRPVQVLWRRPRSVQELMCIAMRRRSPIRLNSTLPWRSNARSTEGCRAAGLVMPASSVASNMARCLTLKCRKVQGAALRREVRSGVDSGPSPERIRTTRLRRLC